MFFKNEHGEIFDVEKFSSFQLEAKPSEENQELLSSSKNNYGYLWSVWGYYTSGAKVLLYEPGEDKAMAQEFIMYLIDKIKIFDKYKVITVDDFLNRQL